MNTGAICRLGLFCFFLPFFARIRPTAAVLLWYFRVLAGAVCRFGLFCVFLLSFRPLLVSPLPLCPSFVLPILFLPWVRGQGTLQYLAVLALLVFLYSRSYQNSYYNCSIVVVSR